jgi:hypothetical protein
MEVVMGSLSVEQAVASRRASLETLSELRDTNGTIKPIKCRFMGRLPPPYCVA